VKTGGSIILFFLLIAVLSPLIAPFSYKDIVSPSLRLPPVWEQAEKSPHVLGTDDLGRDVFSRLIYGTPVSIFIGFSVVLFSISIGTLLALIAGTKGGLVDQVLSRIIDVMMAIPSLLLSIVVVAILGPSLRNTIIAVGLTAIPSIFRIVRAQVIVEMKKNYVIAAQTFGASWTRIAFGHVLVNCMAPILVQASLGFSEGVLSAAALGFLGLGAQPPIPEWGAMLSDSRNYLESSPWLVTLPGLCILLVVIGFNLLGDGLRDYFDPKLRQKS
jgi:ABC-type dipeptide/oligopeptide/nickel transport system permease subunit